MKRKDSRLLNECKDKLIAVVHTLNAGDPPDPTTFENFVKATEYYESITQEYNQLITNAENLHRRIVEHEKTIKDIKERTKAAIVMYYGKNSHYYQRFMQSSEYKKSVKRNQLKEKKLKGL